MFDGATDTTKDSTFRGHSDSGIYNRGDSRGINNNSGENDDDSDDDDEDNDNDGDDDDDDDVQDREESNGDGKMTMTSIPIFGRRKKRSAATTAVAVTTSESVENIVELMIAIDNEMAQYHGSGLHNYILTLMSMVSETRVAYLFLDFSPMYS